MRVAYPVAALEAAQYNMRGGKRKPKEESSEPPLAPHERYTALELLPWFARPSWVESALPGISAEAAIDFKRHRRDLPEWVLAIAPHDAIKRAAK